MDVLQRDLEEPTERRSPARTRALLVLAAILVLVAGIVIGRSTGPIHRHALPAPRMPLLSLAASCKQVPARDFVSNAPDPNEPTYRIDVPAEFRSGWPEGTERGQGPAAAVAFRAPADQFWSMDLAHDQQEERTNPFASYGFYGARLSHKLAERWRQQMRDEGYDMGYPGDRSVIWLTDREGKGLLAFYGAPNRRPIGTGVERVYGPVRSSSVEIVVGFFDVDGHMQERSLIATCHPKPGAVYRDPGAL